MPARRRALTVLAASLVAGALAALACGDTSGGDGTPVAATPATTLDRLVAAYPDATVDPARAAWEALLADANFASEPVAVVEFVRLAERDGAANGYDAFVETLATATERAGGEMLAVNDIMLSGLAGLEAYAGGVSWVASFPSLSAYVDVALDGQVIAAAARRRDAIVEAQTLAGPNLLPEVILQLPPNEPASAFPSALVAGKTDEQIIDELLAVYPAGGADPTREALEAMVASDGFEDQRVHFINLYRFNDAPGGGEAALGEYNSEALPFVLEHGGRPKVLTNVTHHLVGPTEWDRFIVVSWPSLAVFTDLRLTPGYIEAQKSRVVSGEQYGNLVNIARGDAPPSVSTLTGPQGWPRAEGLRGERYCEVLLARIIDGRLNAEVWNSYGMNDCPQEEWAALDPAAIKEERGVLAALLNGPRYWLMDAIEKAPSEREETTFGGVGMFLAATVDLGPPPPDLAPYTERSVARNSVFEFAAGSEVYELTDPAGRVFVMQAYSVQANASLTELDLPKLGGVIKPPAGWSYQARVLHDPLRIASATAESTVVQDELGNTYSLVGLP